MSDLCARDFSEYIEVETPTEAADGFGGYTDVWSSKTFLWCKVDDTGGSEPLSNGRLETSLSVVLATQYRDDISVLDRAILDGVTYNIRRVENVNRKSLNLRIYAESGVTT